MRCVYVLCLLAAAALQLPGALADIQLSEVTRYSDRGQAERAAAHVQPTTSNLLKIGWSSEAATCSMKHSPSSSRVTSTSGENLYMPSWTNAAQAWYDEVHDFRYGVGSINGGVVGLYTQVVWYRSVTYCPNATYKWPLLPHGPLLADPPLQVRADLRRMPRHRDNNPCLYNDQYSNCPELQQQWGCSHSDVASWCPASCRRTNQII
uniref:ShKT domain-containing protein n=1 Tax=Poecilia latipinna TaxID=48699 RepID=A0A3B3TR99_9TELE